MKKKRSARENRDRKAISDQNIDRQNRYSKRFVPFLLPAALLAIVATGFWFLRSPQQPTADIRGVLLISIDTCRADYLSCYGHDRRTTPNIDAIAAEGILFENTITPVPLTLPAHSTMLTGTSPLYHGVHDNKGYKLEPSNVTLAERLREKGFATGAVISAFVMDSQFGLDQGFDTYDDKFDQTFGNVVEIAERKGGEVSRHAEKWLEDHHRDPFFLFLHYFDPHTNYKPPEPFASQFASSPYAGEVAYTDYCIGQVIKKLKALGVYENTLVIITADHGEMLGEHGEDTHGYFVYESALKIPLVFKLPGQKEARRVKELVGLTDIVPTVCGYLGMDPPEHTQGRDLSSCLRGGKLPPQDAKLYCESFLPTMYDACSLLGIVTDRWKYIQTTRSELYDLVNDPGETNNVLDKYPQEAQGLHEALRHILKEQGRSASETGLELDAGAQRRLESLGYIGGGSVVNPSATNDFGFDANKDDPKDIIEFHKMDVALRMWLALEDYDKAEKISKKLLAERPNHPNLIPAMADIAIGKNDLPAAFAYLRKALKLDADNSRIHSQLGFVLVKQGKLDEAIKHCRRALELGCIESVTHQSLGAAFFRQGKYEEAVVHFSKALDISTEKGKHELAEIHHNLGSALLELGKNKEADILFKKARQLGYKQSGTSERQGLELLRQGKVQEAIALFRKALATEPDNAALHVNLGVVLASRGKLDEAIEQFNKALAADPKMAKAHGNLANALLQKNKLDEAISHFKKALEIQPEEPRLLSALGSAYKRQQRFEQAVDCWNRALRLNPDWPILLNNLAWLKATHKDARFRDPEEAIRLASRACELTKFKQPSPLATLAAAYAAVGKFEQSVETSKKVLDLARVSGQAKEIAEAQRQLKLYEAGKPFQDSGVPKSSTKRLEQK